MGPAPPGLYLNLKFKRGAKKNVCRLILDEPQQMVLFDLYFEM